MDQSQQEKERERAGLSPPGCFPRFLSRTHGAVCTGAGSVPSPFPYPTPSDLIDGIPFHLVLLLHSCTDVIDTDVVKRVLPFVVSVLQTYSKGNIDNKVSSVVPKGKGVSSSATVEVATMSAIANAHGLNISPRELALLCQKDNGARRLCDAKVLGFQLERASGRDISIPEWYTNAQNELGFRTGSPQSSDDANNNFSFF
ncbi:unnamed protein product [Lactuca saligna]|uniref:GHMP kinase N-terminal domain-containing protein n=1 Tax=Lactuca saligna TaxID=75948 RepID=A0AA35V0Y9_LACSI|nr:unnamed protein product [Lactuca saligna]